MSNHLDNIVQQPELKPISLEPIASLATSHSHLAFFFSFYYHYFFFLSLGLSTEAFMGNTIIKT